MLPDARHWSLNSVRVFETTARLQSLKDAAIELGVTASAVSHQIRHLETELGCALFIRRHNLVTLTPEGERFFRDVGPALRTIVQARRALHKRSSELVVKVSPSLGLRWLIPRLGGFRQSHPRIAIRVEMASLPITLGPDADVALAYVRNGQQPAGGQHLLLDHGHLVAAPSLIRDLPPAENVTAYLEALPVIAATPDDWDWKSYCELAGFEFAKLRFGARFDTDHAAIEACIRELGMFIAPRAFINSELADQKLMIVPGAPVLKFGEYWLTSSKPMAPEADIFVEWATRTAATTIQ